MQRLHVRVVVLIGIVAIGTLATAWSLRGPSTAQAQSPGTPRGMPSSSLMNRLSPNSANSNEGTIPSANELFGGAQQPDHTIVKPTVTPNTGSTLQVVPGSASRNPREMTPPSTARINTPSRGPSERSYPVRTTGYDDAPASPAERAPGPAFGNPGASAFPTTPTPSAPAATKSAAADPFGGSNYTNDSYPTTSTPTNTTPSYPSTNSGYSTNPRNSNNVSEPRRFEPPAEVYDARPVSGTSNLGGTRSMGGESNGSGRPGGRELEGPQTPSLEVEKLAPAEVQVGKAATFEIRVRNVGRAAAQDVTLEDDVPQGTQLVATNPPAKRGPRGELTWSLGTLKPSEEATVKVELMPTSEGELGSVARARFAAEASVRTISTRPLLAVEVSAPREVLIGESMVLKIKISNPGTGVATGIMLSEHVPELFEHVGGKELENEIGDLQPNETRELTLSMKATKAGPTANWIVARGDGQLQAEEKTPVFVVAPDLRVAIDGRKKHILDRKATYTVNIANPGTASADGVRLVSYLPAGMEFIDANNAGEYDPQTHSVHWLLAELPAKQQGSVTVTTRPVEPGDQTLRVVSSTERGLVVEAKEQIQVEGVAALLFQVADAVDPIEVGGETSYDIHVVNQGTKVATNVQILALLPPEMKAVSAEGPSRYQIEGSQVRFLPLARLAPKDETTYRLRVQGLSPGDLRIRVQLSSDDTHTPITKEESTHVYSDR